MSVGWKPKVRLLFGNELQVFRVREDNKITHHEVLLTALDGVWVRAEHCFVLGIFSKRLWSFPGSPNWEVVAIKALVIAASLPTLNHVYEEDFIVGRKSSN